MITTSTLKSHYIIYLIGIDSYYPERTLSRVLFYYTLNIKNTKIQLFLFIYVRSLNFNFILRLFTSEVWDRTSFLGLVTFCDTEVWVLWLYLVSDAIFSDFFYHHKNFEATQTLKSLYLTSIELYLASKTSITSFQPKLI